MSAEHAEPEIVERAAIHVVGMTGRFTPATIPEIAAMWGRFAPRMATIPGRVHGRADRVSYGACRPEKPEKPEKNAEHGDAAFAYTACVEVERLDRIPNGLVGFTIPAGTYARFTHKGHIQAIGATFEAIFGRWLPAAKLTRAEGYDFELYDERWDPTTGMGDVDIFIPVERPRTVR